MYPLLERLDDVFDDVVATRLGRRRQSVATLATRLEDLLALRFDLCACFFEAILGQLFGVLVGLLADLLGPLARLLEALFAFRFGLGDDVVTFALGLLDLVENLGPGHLSVVICESAYMGVAKYSRSFGNLFLLWEPVFPWCPRSLELCRRRPNPGQMGILENKSRARLFYKYLSRVYDRVNPFIWNERMRTDALELLDLAADDRVLDVGCGTGFGTEGIIEHTDEVYGLDQSPHQLEKATAKLGDDPVQFCLGDAERLPFADDTFDVVWSSGSIEYWPNPVDALEECRRVTRPRGQVLVVGPNYPRSSLFQKLADAIMLFYDEDDADRMFAAAGFEDVEHVTMGPGYNPEIAITTVARVPA